MRLLACLFAAALLSGCAIHPGGLNDLRRAPDRRDVQARVQAGTLTGFEAGGVRAFLGVPYAAPPVGPLRWRPPQPVPVWTGARDATRIGPDCTQAIGRKAILGGGGGIVFGSEDCLTLNIYAPAGDAPAPRPVMVYLPGGAFTVGSAANYDPRRLATEQGQVVVTVNYRLGALGWLAHPSFASEGDGVGGNWGLMDQQAALRWVQANIAAFGGDPRDVTLFAESAGAWSACTLMAAPSSQGLWRQVILQSGACTEPTSLWSDREAAAGGPAFAASVGCDGADVVACLRAVPARRLARAASTRPGLNGPGSWGPVYGDALVPKAPPQAFADGDFVRTPVLIGTNRDEGRLFAVEVRSSRRYKQEIGWTYGDDAPAVLARYPVDAAGPAEAMARSFTDQKFACPASALRRLLARHVPVSGYEFADPEAPTIIPRWLVPYDMGAFHASELTSVFGTRWALADPARFTPAQTDLAARMRRDWARFGREDGQGDWPRVAPDQDRVRILSPEGEEADDAFAARHACAFWETLKFGPVSPAATAP